MTPRSIRRAAERKAAKQARKAERHSLVADEVEAPETEPHALASGSHTASLSEARLVANRANAQFSTGPASDAGKAISCLNAVKTGLTGRTVLLRSDDAEAYRRHIVAYEDEYQPIGLRECELVQSLADTQWRLNRIPALEMAIYAQGHMEFAHDFDEYPAELRPAMIELQTHTNYEKQLRNLHLQETRLFRRFQREMGELRELQQARHASESEIPEYQTQTGLGFEFSNAPSETAHHSAQDFSAALSSTHIPASPPCPALS